MTTFTRSLRRVISRRPPEDSQATGTAAAGDDAAVGGVAQAPPVDIAPNDPIIGYFQSATGAVDIEALELDSAGLQALRDAGVKLVVPLVSQGELIGLLNLGPRLSERDYSGDDRKLLDRLAAQAAPALRVGQLVQEQEAQARTTERLEQEMRVATLIQQQFLPKELPKLQGWQVAAFYRPARAVGGDFYDFIELANGRVALVAGDVTDKGVPAALVMASTRSILRGAAARSVSPGKVLEQANDLLFPDIPGHMFVTCLYAVLDPSTGHLVFANAGHNVPYVKTSTGVTEFRATGMPLGLMPGMTYEEKEATLAPGERMLLHSDGLAEAHAPDGDMFGFPRIAEIMTQLRGDANSNALIDNLLAELDRFTGAGWEQEDDITLVSMERTKGSAAFSGDGAATQRHDLPAGTGQPTTLLELELPSEQGNERVAMERVAEVVQGLALGEARLERLKTAVAEATMNAIEHGNHSRPELPVAIAVTLGGDNRLTVRITDQGSAETIPDPQTPNLEAKLAGEQTPRGWGLFLIKNMVDEMRITGDAHHHTIELVVKLGGGGDAS